MGSAFHDLWSCSSFFFPMWRLCFEAALAPQNCLQIQFSKDFSYCIYLCISREMYYKVIVDKKGAKLICGQCFANFHQCQHLLDKKKFLFKSPKYLEGLLYNKTLSYLDFTSILQKIFHTQSLFTHSLMILFLPAYEWPVPKLILIF